MASRKVEKRTGKSSFLIPSFTACPSGLLRSSITLKPTGLGIVKVPLLLTSSKGHSFFGHFLPKMYDLPKSASSLTHVSIASLDSCSRLLFLTIIVFRVPV